MSLSQKCLSLCRFSNVRSKVAAVWARMARFCTMHCVFLIALFVSSFLCATNLVLVSCHDMSVLMATLVVVALIAVSVPLLWCCGVEIVKSYKRIATLTAVRLERIMATDLMDFTFGGVILPSLFSLLSLGDKSGDKSEAKSEAYSGAYSEVNSTKSAVNSTVNTTKSAVNLIEANSTKSNLAKSAMNMDMSATWQLIGMSILGSYFCLVALVVRRNRVLNTLKSIAKTAASAALMLVLKEKYSVAFYPALVLILFYIYKASSREGAIYLEDFPTEERINEGDEMV